MASTYKKYLKLLEKWPVDTSKIDKDLGQHIRDQLKIAFSSDSKINVQQCERYYESLKNIESNKYRNQYKLKVITKTSCGLTDKESNLILSSEGIKLLQEDEEGLFDKLSYRFKNAVTSETTTISNKSEKVEKIH